MQIPYQKALDALLARLDETGERPMLLLHCCCAPCRPNRIRPRA